MWKYFKIMSKYIYNMQLNVLRTIKKNPTLPVKSSISKLKIILQGSQKKFNNETLK